MGPLAGFGDEDVYLQGNIWEQYLLCYYWTVATLTTNGQIGEMGPKCMLEVRTPIPAVCDTRQSEPTPAAMTPCSHYLQLISSDSGPWCLLDTTPVLAATLLALPWFVHAQHSQQRCLS